MDVSYGEAAAAMMCPDCRLGLEQELEKMRFKPTNNPVKAALQARKLISTINRVCCPDCLGNLRSEGVRWAHDHPEEIQKARRER